MPVLMTNVTCDTCVHYVECIVRRITLNIGDIVPKVVNCDRYVRSVRRDELQLNRAKIRIPPGS